jgi:hypothetical protein
MRFYSDELKKFFNTEAECLAAEEKARVEVEEKKVTKAKLAKAVEDADKALDNAYVGLEDAKKKVAELQKEYDAKVDAIMNPARDCVKECTKKRAEAIKTFNEKFGTYTTTYTGNKAINEALKLDTILDNMFNFNKFYW